MKFHTYSTTNWTGGGIPTTLYHMHRTHTGDSHLMFPSQLPSYPVEDDVGHAYPGHMEEHDFMTAFFQNQEDEDSVCLIRTVQLQPSTSMSMCAVW